MKTVAVVVISAAMSFGIAARASRFGIPVVAAKATEAPASGIEKSVIAAEREGLEALKAGDVEKFRNLTADEAVFVDSDGPANKKRVLQNVAGFRLTEFSMESVQFIQLSQDTGFITYKLTESGVSLGKEFSGQTFVSSIWTERGGKWLCLFSQETAAR